MTSELTMNYVGKESQEILSAITAAIWSGSWYFSSQIFRFLKSMDMPYAYIFYTQQPCMLLVYLPIIYLFWIMKGERNISNFFK